MVEKIVEKLIEVPCIVEKFVLGDPEFVGFAAKSNREVVVREVREPKIYYCDQKVPSTERDWRAFVERAFLEKSNRKEPLVIIKSSNGTMEPNSASPITSCITGRSSVPIPEPAMSPRKLTITEILEILREKCDISDKDFMEAAKTHFEANPEES